jgi:hypothetical protein
MGYRIGQKLQILLQETLQKDKIYRIRSTTVQEYISNIIILTQ